MLDSHPLPSLSDTIRTPLLVGVGGHKGSGKDEFASALFHIGEEIDEHWTVLGFSDALLSALLTLDPWIDVEHGGKRRLSEIVLEMGYVSAKKIPEVRRLLQVLGTDVVRNQIDEDAWVRAAEKKILGAWDMGLNVVITGVRYPNEAAMVRRLRGSLVYLNRRRFNGDGHPSEHSLLREDFDVQIFNYGTLDDLKYDANIYYRDDLRTALRA